MILQVHLHQQDANPFVHYAFNEMKVGESIDLEGPEGDFILDEESARPIVMVAVDTGFAPLKSIIEHAIALDLQQAIHLYWLVTNKHHHYLDNLCRSWEFALETFLYQPMTVPHENNQLTTMLTEIIDRSPIETELDLYLCGPNKLLTPLREKFIEKGTPKSRIFEEVV
jgi:CDP-4-dehydro-6-deoxyglucose reductase